jgi:uncharacterized OsmC-like protein
MANQDIAAALRRAEAIFQRRPEAALSDDAPATARWESGTRVVSSHASGAHLVTDMPSELGGSGDRPSPGWLMRAGLASCAATRIAMAAAAQGVELTKLEVLASSQSDARGLFGMQEADGSRVPASPMDVQLHVQIAALGHGAGQLHALVQGAHVLSPVSAALQNQVPVALHIEVVSA